MITYLLILVLSAFKNTKVLPCKYFNAEEVKRETNNINSEKGTPKDDTPVKIKR